MRIYLDTCSLNRPYDALDLTTVNLEAQAKLTIQGWIREGKYDLVSSEMLLTEISEIPVELRKRGITSYIEENAAVHVGPGNNGTVHEMALELVRKQIGYKDACHAASAILAGCSYLITTDYRFIKRFRRLDTELKIIDPIEFVRVMEQQNVDEPTDDTGDKEGKHDE